MIRFVRFPKYHSITHTHTHSERDEIHDKFKRVHATRDETRQITKETIRFRTWCSSAKRENINGPAFSFFLQECQLYHSYHLYHSFISQENDSNSNAQRHTQVLRKLNSRFALEHRYSIPKYNPRDWVKPQIGDFSCEKRDFREIKLDTIVSLSKRCEYVLGQAGRRLNEPVHVTSFEHLSQVFQTAVVRQCSRMFCRSLMF